MFNELWILWAHVQVCLENIGRLTPGLAETVLQYKLAHREEMKSWPQTDAKMVPIVTGSDACHSAA